MHMRTKKWARPELAACPFYINHDGVEILRGTWRQRFAHPERPLHIEMGCGKGVSTARMIADNPEINYLISDMSPDVLGTARRNILEACGGKTDDYEIDGQSLLGMILNNESCEHEYLFWEMENQNAVRYGNYKLVLNGRLTESEGPRAPVFLSDLSTDPGEKHNLSEEMPELRDKLTDAALKWREGIEDKWEKEFAANYSLTR